MWTGDAQLKLGRAFHRDVYVSFQRARFVDRCQHGGGRNPVAHAYRNIAHNAARPAGHAVVVQLYFLLLHLGVQSVQLRLCSVEGRFRLVEILLADHSGGIESAGPVILLLRPFQVGHLGILGILLRLDCGLLLGRIDLHQGR